MTSPSVYFNRPRVENFKHSAKGEEDDDGDEPPTSKRTGADVHIMTTKVNVSEDVKKVEPIFRSQRS